MADISYALLCGRTTRRPVSVRSGLHEDGWHAAIVWTAESGAMTMAATGPHITRREAVLTLRRHLQERRHA